MTGTVLIIAYYFPPLGMGGVQRMGKLAKYLPECGYDVIVLTVKPIRYPAHDPSLLEELPASVKIYRSGSSDPGRIGKFIWMPVKPGSHLAAMAKTSGRLWPDSRIGWRRPALRLAEKIIRRHPVDIILSSSPPITGHMVAAEAARGFSLPWVADFRDYWESLPPEQLYDDSKLIDKSRALLDDIASTADATTAVNETIARYISENTLSIMGGHDPDDFDFPVSATDDESFTLCYMGTAGPLGPIEPFFRAAQSAFAADPKLASRLRFKLVGVNDGKLIRSLAESCGLAGKVDVTGYLPHREAIREAAGSAALLLSVPETHPGILTGKIFDYLALPSPILAAVPSGGEADLLIRRYNGGFSCAPDDIAGLTEGIRGLYDRYRNKTAWQKHDIADLSRLEVASQFGRLFDRITGDRK